MSSKITLAAETGRATGSRPSGRLRAAGRIPGVVYGHGMAPVPVAVDHRELRAALSGPAGVNAVVHLSFDGSEHPTVVKDLQRDPVRRTVDHIDFQVVRMDEKISVDVPLVLQGEAVKVGRADGIVEHLLTSLTVTTTPATIPSEIAVDISALEMGEPIRVGDLSLPDGVTTDVDPDEAVVVGTMPQKAEAEVPAVEGIEGEAVEGEAAAAEAGGEGAE